MGPDLYLFPAKTISGLLDGFDAVGLDTNVMLRHLGIAREWFLEPYVIAPHGWFYELYEIAFQQDPSPDLPVRVGLNTPLGAFGLIDYLVGSAETVGGGLNTIAQFHHLIASSVRYKLDHTGGDTISLTHSRPSLSDWINDAWALGVTKGRWSRFCETFSFTEVRLVGLKDVPSTRFEELFNAPVYMNAERSHAKLAAGVWDTKLQNSDPTLHATLQKLAQSVEVKQFQSAPFAYLVRTKLAQAIPEGKFSAQEIAGLLGMPLRTFQRRLSAEHIVFQTLLDDYRHQMALKLLLRPNLTMSEVAHTLGYNEQSSFNRAFRRWTGKAPGVWLEQGAGRGVL